LNQPGAQAKTVAEIDLAQLVCAIGDALVVTDADGLIRLWNPAAERLFGFTVAEALGRSLDLITPERHRQRHWHGYHQTMATGITKYGSDLLRVPALAKDGRTLSIAFTVALLFGDNGKPMAIAAVIRDDTARFREEREMRKRLGELEEQLAATPK
jgi:PAS domain S-box-containing protein